MGKHIVFIDPNIPEEELKHYGVLGMKWGRRKASGELSPRAKKRQERKKQKADDKADKKYIKKADRKILNAYNKTVNEHNPKVKEFNEQYFKKVGHKNASTMTTNELKKYYKSYDDSFNSLFKKNLSESIGTHSESGRITVDDILNNSWLTSRAAESEF